MPFHPLLLEGAEVEVVPEEVGPPEAVEEAVEVEAGKRMLFISLPITNTSRVDLMIQSKHP